MRNQAKMCISVALVLVGMVCISSAQAVLDTQTYGFYNITNNSAANALTGESQLLVEVLEKEPDVGSLNLVGFKFINSGPADCAITEIYFQTGSILGFASIDESLPKVDFKEEFIGTDSKGDAVSPVNLPGGESIDPKFIATTALSIEPVNPEPYWGIEPGEWVEIVYSLKADKTYENIIEELENADLRIGIHVQSYADDGSESFVNVPEPASMALLALSGLILRKYQKV
jgi:hypothetical protein